MPYRAYTDAQKTEAMEVIAQHAGDLQAAQAELMQRWGCAPSVPTLSTWALSGQNGHGRAITPSTPEARKNEALKRFEGSQYTPWESLLKAVGQMAEDPDYLVIVIGKKEAVQ